MRIGIIGPGALGCLFATKLFSAAGEQDSVLLIDHRPERAKHLNASGITYESAHGIECFSIPVKNAPEDVGPLDVLFSCVKSYDLQDSLEFYATLLHPSTLLIFLQNGISHLQYAEDDSIPATVVFASSSEGATRLGHGHIRHAGSGHTWLGFPATPNTKALTKLQQLLVILQNGGLASSISDDILTRLWAKLFVNVGINGLTATQDCSNGQLLESSTTRSNLEKLVKEAEQVARAAHVSIDETPLRATLTVCKKTATNISSMLQDVRNRRPTEIDAINGSISRIGRKLTIPTPENDRLIAQIKEIENNYPKEIV